MDTMKFISIPEPGKVEIGEMLKPQAQPGEVLLKILWGGICGSDMGTYRGSFLYASYPRIPGHEFSAEIVALGEGVTGLKPGMIVTGNPYYNCGACYSCQRGHVNCCTDNQTLGAQRDGIFREYFSMPAERVYDGHGLDAQSLVLVEPFCISYHAVKRASVQKNERVLIVGAGPIGTFALLAAKAQGAEVTVCDLAEQRLQKSLELGADHIICSATSDLITEVKSLTNGNGFDVCIECVGLPSTFQNCIDAAAYRGRVVLVGVGKKNLDFQFTILQTKELDVFGSRNALKEDFIDLIDKISTGVFNPKALITDVFEMDDAGSAFHELDVNGGNMLKTLIRFA